MHPCPQAFFLTPLRGVIWSKLQEISYDVEEPEASNSLGSLVNDIFLGWISKAFAGSWLPGAASSRWHQRTSTSCVQESSSAVYPKKQDKVEQKNKNGRCDQNLGQSKQLQEGANDPKCTCLGCWLYRFLVRGQARKTVRYGYSIAHCLVLCQIPV